jgi:hypothetical protein
VCSYHVIALRIPFTNHKSLSRIICSYVFIRLQQLLTRLLVSGLMVSPSATSAEENTMSMSKRDFVALGDAVRGLVTSDDGSSVEMAAVVETLADFCQSTNPRFKRDRWLSYIAGECGPNGGRLASKPRQRVTCDQCQMLSINGVACHETGCPNIGARWESGTWVKQRKCFDCGCTVDASEPCCEVSDVN